jgi:hypothetical protein
MKPFTRTWIIGQRVQGRVTEQLPSGELIISFEGDLLRVSNESRHKFTAGDLVDLQVASQNPVTLKLATKLRSRRSPGHFDVSV